MVGMYTWYTDIGWQQVRFLSSTLQSDHTVPKTSWEDAKTLMKWKSWRLTRHLGDVTANIILCISGSTTPHHIDFHYHLYHPAISHSKWLQMQLRCILIKPQYIQSNRWYWTPLRPVNHAAFVVHLLPVVPLWQRLKDFQTISHADIFGFMNNIKLGSWML